MDTDYFDWLVDIIDDGRAEDYQDLLYNLADVRFYWSVRNDDNRENDGLDLRYKFMDEALPFEIDEPLGFGPLYCTVFEVMVALAIRMENILYDPAYGDQTARWFWVMIENLGLSDLTDDRFDADKFDEIMDIFLNRTYEKNGIGGLFVTRDRNFDMRNTEIWYQMMQFINENYENFDEN